MRSEIPDSTRSTSIEEDIHSAERLRLSCLAMILPTDLEKANLHLQHLVSKVRQAVFKESHTANHQRFRRGSCSLAALEATPSVLDRQHSLLVSAARRHSRLEAGGPQIQHTRHSHLRAVAASLMNLAAPVANCKERGSLAQEVAANFPVPRAN